MNYEHKDYRFNEQVSIPFQAMKDWIRDIFCSYGMDREDAETVADHLVVADAKGIYSHGCMRTSIYCKRIEKGGTSATAKPEVRMEQGAVATVDGHNAMGQVVARYATEKAAELALKYGTSAVSVTGSNHLGACGYYAEMLSKRNMIGFCWTINGGNNMAPWGGCERQLGNNPFAVAVPCGKYPDVVFDMATSVVARGKIVMAMKTHADIPDNWALDVNGNPTTNAEAGYWGTMRPVGDYKGYGLTFINAIISAILSDSCFGPEISDFYELPEIVQNTGHLFQAIDISRFIDLERFKSRMDFAVGYLKSGKKAENAEEIWVPGEMEAIKFHRALSEGIMYPVEILEEIKELAKKQGVYSVY